MKKVSCLCYCRGAVLLFAGGLLAGPLDEWTQRNPAAMQIQPNTLTALAYGGGVFTGVGSRGPAIFSPDGIAWGLANPGTKPLLVSVAYGDGNFVAVGGNGLIYASQGGINWSAQTSGTKLPSP